MKKSEKKTSIKKGEPGYFPRNTDPAHQACSTFETPEEFTACADAYFDECDKNGELYGEAGLCLYLSKHNKKGKPVTLGSLRRWYDGERNEALQPAVQLAYLRIQAQIESDARYREKGGMATRAIFLQKQPRLGGYQDRVEQKNDTTVRIVHGTSVDMSDFE